MISPSSPSSGNEDDPSRQGPPLPASGDQDGGDGSLPIEQWMCGARTKSRGGEPCRSPAMPNGRCRVHGGKSLKGAASPRFKTGRYSRSFAASLPANLREKFEQALADPELLSLRSYVALLDAKVTDAIERYTASDAGEFRERLQQAWRKLEAANAAKDVEQVGSLLKEIGEVIRLGAAEHEAWAEVASAMKDRVAVSVQEQRRLIDMEQVLTIEQAMSLVIVLHSVVSKHVTDNRTLSAIGTDLEIQLGLGAP